MTEANESIQLWGGRFKEQKVNEILKKLNNSLPIDQRLYNEDIDGSKMYAKGLANVNLLNADELDKILNGLEMVRNEWIEMGDDNKSKIVFLSTDEDVHTVNERRLTELIGPVAGKLHTGRSRNDQIATDMKLWARKATNDILLNIYTLLNCMIEKSLTSIDILMAGYTHLQRAQPIRFSHWLLSHAFSLQADCLRFEDTVKRIDSLPLGSGALAGNPFNINRHELAKDLNFNMITPNSMYAVSDRDFIMEFNFVASLTAIHLSRLSEDIIIYTTKEFGFIELSENFSTGSSLMPQKRNPDSLELVRGLSGEIFGKQCGFMMTMKGLPSTYNKDMQFDKTAMFSIFDQLISSLKIMVGVIETFTVKPDKCVNSLSFDMLATDVAYYLVRKGMPFRQAHHMSGQVIAYAENLSININEIKLNDLQKLCPLFDETIQDIWSYEKSVEQYSAIGGTAKHCVEHQIEILKKFLCDRNVI